jgi:cellulose synthase/poly-beta-1,6-N-acetylglucosamine synthase-like glycosyltransferase
MQHEGSGNMQAWLIIELITLVFSIPVLSMSYYWLVLLASALSYPKSIGSENIFRSDYPLVSILIASFNERFVIGRSLEAFKKLDYPKEKIQVVVADDSTDETIQLIDFKAEELDRAGIHTIISRRPTRENFKCGALNKAMEYVDGEYVLLLDADSIVPPDVITKGINAIETHPRTSFVSYRYGHYNRDYNRITELFALSQDLGDTVSKIGSYSIDAPFSFQGGFTLIRTKDLRDVGQWSNERIADDADVSIKLYLAGKRGIYLSNVRIMSEDPSTLEAWKKQVARTSQGWWRCIAKYWRRIISSRNISVPKKAGLFLMLMGPFSSLSWIIVAFLSALAVVFGLVPPPNSIFSSPIYVTVLAFPFVIFLASGAWALKVQGILTFRNAMIIPLLSYATGCTLTLGSIGFFYGVFDRLGFFVYRTPKSGSEKEMTKTKYFNSLTNDRNAIVEGVLSTAAIILAALVLFQGVWVLSLSLGGFGLFTLKSMNLTRHLKHPKRPLSPELKEPLEEVVVRSQRQLHDAIPSSDIK